MIDAEVARIRYARDNHNRPVGCVVILHDGRIGFSQCHWKDRFSKKEGRELAIKRAKGLEPQPEKVLYKYRNIQTINKAPSYHNSFVEDLIGWEVELLQNWFVTRDLFKPQPSFWIRFFNFMRF